MNFWGRVRAPGWVPVLKFILLAGVSRVDVGLGQEAPAALELRTGKEIYQAACIACHGPEGRGMPQTTSGFDRPDTFPDFTDCKSTAREPNNDWRAIIHDGGRARGFSEIMPSFAEALTANQIDTVIRYLRGFCREPAWLRGELNLPRAFFTDKAFPEDEALVTTILNTQGPPEIANAIIYERRFASRNQIELNVPITTYRGDTYRPCVPAPAWYADLIPCFL